MYLFLAVFLSMMIYFVYFQVCKSESFINSPYNSLQDLFSDHVIRGDIVSADGKVLATTKVSADGTQTRSYPQGRMFAHAVGYAVNGKAGLENQENFSLLRSDAGCTDSAGGIQISWKLSGSCDCYGTGYRKNHCNGVKTGL